MVQTLLANCIYVYRFTPAKTGLTIKIITVSQEFVSFYFRQLWEREEVPPVVCLAYKKGYHYANSIAINNHWQLFVLSKN